MALTFAKYPQEISFIDSPQFVTIEYDSSLGAPTDKLFIEIRRWTGDKSSVPVAADHTLFQTPGDIGLGNFTNTFEVATFIKEVVDFDDYIPTGPTKYNEANGAWYQVKASLATTGGVPTVTATTQFATGGYGLYKSGTNPGTTIAAVDGMVFGAQGETMVFKDDMDYMIPVYIGDTSTNIEIQSPTAGDFDLNVDLGFVLNSTLSTRQIAYVRFGTTLYGVTWKEGTSLQYLINDVLSTNNFIHTAIIECNKSANMVLKFINQKGTMSSLPVNGKDEFTSQFTKTNYRNVVLDTNFNYDDTEHVNKTFISNGNEIIQVFTGWIYEDTNQMIQELLLSKTVWLDYGAIVYPVQIQDRTKRFINRTFNSEIGYDLTLRVAHSIINQEL